MVFYASTQFSKSYLEKKTFRKNDPDAKQLLSFPQDLRKTPISKTNLIQNRIKHPVLEDLVTKLDPVVEKFVRIDPLTFAAHRSHRVPPRDLRLGLRVEPKSKHRKHLLKLNVDE